MVFAAKSQILPTHVSLAPERAARASPAPAFTDHRAEALALRQQVDAVHNGPRMTAQRRQADGLSRPRLQVQGGHQQGLVPAEPGTLLPQQAPAYEPNRTGLPDGLKSAMESLAGLSLDGVRVHRNSARPGRLGALAYAQGSEIHLAPGQEQHLAHEAWHVVQQAQGRVASTTQLKSGLALNDDPALEREADVMGARATGASLRGTSSPGQHGPSPQGPRRAIGIVQRQQVIQLRGVPEIDNALDQLLSDVAAIADISEFAAVGTIVARQGVLPPLRLRLSALKTEVTELRGGEVASLSTIDSSMSEISTLLPQLTNKIDIASGPAPEKPKTVWGSKPGEASAYLSWQGLNKDLGANQLERARLTTQRADLVRTRPLAVVHDKLSSTEAALRALELNLVRAEMQRYFYLLMTTVTPVRAKYQDEGVWQNGASVLGIFMFNGPDVIQGIPQRVRNVEVHIHFNKGSKHMTRAHIKSGWDYTVLHENGPWYAATALDACKATIGPTEVI